MKRFVIWCVCLMAWLLCFGTAAMASGEFDALCAESDVNRTDVIAWIEIVDADFCQPIMRKVGDDSFYAGHDASGAEFTHGALYVQSAYNAADFSDPVTLIYGGSQGEGAPLRNLQELYSGSFDDCRRLLLHLPDETIEYRVFAAIPYSSIHILHYFDFDQQHRYGDFFEGVYSTRQLGMHLDAECRPEYGDSVLILSTGLRGDNLQRYLVMAKRETI